MTINSASVQSTILVYAAGSGGLASKAATVQKQDTDTYTNGTSSAQINSFWADHRTLAASTAETLDLSGILTDDFGVLISPTKITDIYIRITSSSATAQLALGNVANQWAGAPWSSADTFAIITIGDGGRFHMSNPKTGWTVTNTTGDKLKINNLDASNPVSYDIIILFRV